MIDVNQPLARALRDLQILDEHHNLAEHRYLLIRAETILGQQLGLTCTGTPAIIADDDGLADGYDHNGDTCPIHEWLVDSDAPRTSP